MSTRERTPDAHRWPARFVCLGWLLLAAPAIALPIEDGRTPDRERLTPDSTTAERLARHRLRIAELEDELKRTTDRDSIRFELARAWRGTGTIEGRQRAFDLFAKVKSKYFDRPGYHLELARTYLEANRRADARDEFARALRRDPDNLEARLEVARVLRDYALRYGRPEDAMEAMTFMAETVERLPQSAEAHLEYALCAELARTFVPGDRTRQSLLVINEAAPMLKHDPANRTAQTLRAVALLDLGLADHADRELHRASVLEGPAGREDLLARSWPMPRHWLDPRSEASAPADSFEWVSLDPTPLTPANEAALEYRRRLLLADLFFGDDERGLRGWATPRGELLVRYGPPRSVGFRFAFWEEGEATIGPDLALLRKRAHQNATALAPFQSPVQSWVYEFDGQAVSFDFADPTMQGDFVSVIGPDQAKFMQEYPLVLNDALGGRRVQYFFTAAGTRDADGRTRLNLALALPPASGEVADSSFRPGVRLVDRDGHEVGSVRLAPTGTVIDRGASSADATSTWPLRTARGAVSVPPGNYTADVRFDLERSAGSFTVPVVARSFVAPPPVESGDLVIVSSPPFAVSDLQLEVPPDVPNPAGVTAPHGRVLVRYEVYNFAPAPGGKARYRNRFSVVPRKYALAAARQALEQHSALDEALILDGLGRTLEGVTLNERNYLDVVFPEREEPLVAGARGRFTFELDASTLTPGEYVLTVAVEDRVASRTALSQALLRVLDDAGWRALRLGR